MAKASEKRQRRVEYTDTKKWVEQQDSGWKPTAFKVPEGVEVFKFNKTGLFTFDVIPFVVGKNNPRADKGKVHWERTYWVHSNIGPDNNAYSCLEKTFGKPCPVCNHLRQLRRSPAASEDTIKALKPKQRQLFVFQMHQGKERTLHLYEASYFNGFGELLTNKLDAQPEDSPLRDFFHLGKEGMTLVVKASEDTFNGRTFYPPTNIEMVPRRQEVPESILDEAPCLDDLPIELSYKELEKIFLQETATPTEEEEEETVEGGEEDEDGDEDIPVVKKKSPKLPPKKKKVVEEEEEPEEEEEEEETEEEIEPEKEEEEEAPKPKKKKVRAPIDEEEEDDPIPEEEEDFSVTADDMGIEEGMEVKHKKLGTCKVVHISPDGTSVRLKDKKGNLHKAIAPQDCTPIEVEEEEEEETPKPKKKRMDIDVEEEEVPFEEEEDEELPKKPVRRRGP